jgi:hypothetical protein
MVEVAEAIGLNPIGDDRKQQMPRQMIRRWSLQHALPPRAQTFEIETAQMHDLVLNGCLGHDTLRLIDGSDEVNDEKSLQILLRSIKTLAEKGLGREPS